MAGHRHVHLQAGLLPADRDEELAAQATVREPGVAGSGRVDEIALAATEQLGRELGVHVRIGERSLRFDLGVDVRVRHDMPR